MRSYASRCVIFGASLSTLVALVPGTLRAQSASPAPSTNIWKPAAPLARSTGMPADTNNQQQRDDESTQTRQAFFQDPSAYQNSSDLVMPQLPGVVPASFNQFSNPGGPMAPTNVQLPSAHLREQPSQGGPYHNAAQAPGYGQATYQNMNQQQIPQPQFGQQYPANGFNNGFNNANGFNNPAAQNGLPPSQLRTAPSANGQPIYPPQAPVVSNDPRFISPAPRQSNFATSPYSGPYRTIAYQQQPVLPQVQPQQVQPPSALANQPQSVPNSTGLPQYQPTVVPDWQTIKCNNLVIVDQPSQPMGSRCRPWRGGSTYLATQSDATAVYSR